jgi:hypothetical protein
LVSFDLGKISGKEGYVGMTFKYEKKRWIHRKKKYEDLRLESLYYGMMWACWNSFSDENDMIKEDTPPVVKRAIIREMKRLKKKVGL